MRVADPKRSEAARGSVVVRFPRRFSSRSAAVLLSVALSFVAHSRSSAQPAASNEYDVKGAFLYNFVKFAEWPASAFRDEHAPIVLGIFGEDRFGPQLDSMLEEKTAHGRSFEVRRVSQPSEAAACHVVFIAASAAGRLRDLREAIGARPVLTVGESPDFALQGGLINFVVENNRVLFEINVEQSAASPLKLSSQLLRLARLVPAASARRGSDG